MIGETLANFRIKSRLGAGGMGEVYLADDLTLGRQVALKVLPEDLSRDAERLGRFEREAKVLAALNHPNIAAVYQLEQHDGRRFLVMELVEGRTLETLIPQGGMTLERFFSIAVPLADALAAAHEKGITHRDLKPGNLMVSTDGRLKVLDFGIAKLTRPLGDGDDTARETQPLTVDGLLVGTVPYMSPEQIKGDSVDGRSDIFAAGIILYEMMTGRYPFGGEKPAEILASILKDKPSPLGESRPDAPRRLQRIIHRCMEKDPRQRVQTAVDLHHELRELQRDVELGEAVTESMMAPQNGDSKKRWWKSEGVIAVVLISIFAALFIWQKFRPRSAEPVSGPGESTEQIVAGSGGRQLAQITFGAALEEWPAWSPDGKSIAYAAEVDGFKKLFIQTLATGEIVQATHGPLDDMQPAWAPDSKALYFVRSNQPAGKLQPGDIGGFFSSGGDVWRLDLAHQSEEKLIDEAFHPMVSPSGDRLAVDAEWAGPRRIWSTDLRGRNPRQVTDDSSEAVNHTSAHWSPDGKRLVYRRIGSTTSDIHVLDLTSGESWAITDDDYPDMDPAWSADGAAIILSSPRGGGWNLWRLPVSEEGRAAGAAQQLTTGPGQDLQTASGGPSNRLAFTILQQNADLWTVDVDPVSGEVVGAPEPLVATTREDSRASWSTDGSAIAFNSDRAGAMNLWLLDLATGETRQVTSGHGGDYQPHFSPDGSRLVFFSARSGDNDIWSVDLASGDLVQLTTYRGLDINPFYSPDGESIAYQSDRDGRLEIWVMAPDGSEQRPLTSVGAAGHYLVWADDSRSILFRSGTGPAAKILRIDVESGELTEYPPVSSGAHMSWSPNRELILDVAGHRALWVYPLSTGEPRKVFEFAEPAIRIDYPSWSPDGTRVVFDRVDPQGGDIWSLEGI